MLAHIRVQNIALIDETDIDLEEGLNVLTGETGAGKSILLGAVSLALGSRSSKEAVRDPSRPAEVVLQFLEDRPGVTKALGSLGIDASGGEILLARRFSGNGRSVLLINDAMVTQAKAREVSSLLIDIHGQHDQESLINTARHIDLLDRFIPGMPEYLKQCRDLYEKDQDAGKKLAEFEQNSRDRERLLALMDYELSEIDEAAWQEGEDETLQEEHKKLVHSEKLQRACLKAYQLLNDDSQEEAPALTKVGQALSELESVSPYDNSFFQPYVEELTNYASVLEDISSSLRSYAENLEADPERLTRVEERIDLLDRLKNKYGPDRKAVLAYREKRQEERDRLEHQERTMEELRQQKTEADKALKAKAAEMTALRKKAAESISRQITQVLTTLEFDDPSFQIQIGPKPVGPKGADQVTFLIRTSVGEPVRPLSQIASGGELSRIMLAVKTVLASQDEIGTLIFDEIDSGISGRTAQSVAEKMSSIARYHQVLAVTHLPQIAAMADTHLRIEKVTENDHARTMVTRLSGDSVTEELSRMLGGARITPAVRENAAEMKRLADAWKKEHRES